MILPTDIKNMIMRIMYSLMFDDVINELNRNIRIYDLRNTYPCRPFYYPRYRVFIFE